MELEKQAHSWGQFCYTSPSVADCYSKMQEVFQYVKSKCRGLYECYHGDPGSLEIPSPGFVWTLMEQLKEWLIWDHDGRWIYGFQKYIGRSSTFVAELWGVFQGLKLAILKGFTRILLQVDSKAVILAIRSGNEGSASGWRLIQAIQKFIRMVNQFQINHMYKETNRCVDKLANHDCSLDAYGETWCYRTIAFLSVFVALIFSDAMGSSTPSCRFCVVLGPLAPYIYYKKTLKIKFLKFVILIIFSYVIYIVW